jgi:lipopolysaccharide/colanic/teichoic acid biosynthesis glycosyltransferase
MPKTFNILKFRTMYERPESYQGAKHALNCHPELVEGLSKGLP